MPSAKKEARPSGRASRPRTPAFVKNLRGVKNWKETSAWLDWRGIEDIECITPDQAGVARGKMMPSKKFISNTSLALPSAVFMATISGGYPENGNGFSYPEDETARGHVQFMRHEHDAILTGIGTVFADNCMLTDRTGLPRSRPSYIDARCARVRSPGMPVTSASKSPSRAAAMKASTTSQSASASSGRG